MHRSAAQTPARISNKRVIKLENCTYDKGELVLDVHFDDGTKLIEVLADLTFLDIRREATDINLRVL